MNPRVLKKDDDRARVSQALQEFYAARPSGYAEGVDQEKWDKYADIVARYTGPGRRVLELGSGNWRIPYTIHKRNVEVVGLDVWSEEYFAEQVREMPKDGPTLLRYDGRRLPFPDGTFDAVCSLTVFEHLIDPSSMLSEIHRVLRGGGRHILLSPNWAGPNCAIRAFQSLLMKRQRYWRYETYSDALFGLVRSFLYPIRVWFSKEPVFFFVFPRMEGGRIAFEVTDDDVVHLSCPASYKKWFSQHGYRLLSYNQEIGGKWISRVFNFCFPSWGTSTLIVAEKIAMLQE